jgi:hypothetical protein
MADTFTIFMCRMSGNLGTSTFWNPQGMYMDCVAFAVYCVVDKMLNRSFRAKSNFVKTGVTWWPFAV